MKPQPLAPQRQPGTGLGLRAGVGKGGLELSWLVLLHPHAPTGYW